MDKKLRIAWLSDFDILGSGYQNLSSELCQGLVKAGHEVKAVGMHYMGQEHHFDFSIIPVMNTKEAIIAVYNLRSVWMFDILVVALDINLQNFFLENIQDFRSSFKYVGIMPIEAGPLCMSWAMVLLQMDLPLIISEFGTEEAHLANVVAAKHIKLGLDSELWIPATIEERRKYRKGYLGVDDDTTFVALTVADNQERKNLAAALEAFRDFSITNPNSKYVLITREKNPIGWALGDLKFEYGLQDKLILMERGMSREDLRNIYATADCFLLTSKAEGLGLPLLEAMGMKIPCIATDCTGMRELLDNGRGFLVPPIMVHRDCFGNGKRYWIDIKKTTEELQWVYEGHVPDLEQASEYVKNMTWEKSVSFLNEELMKLGEENVTEASKT